MQTWTVQRQLYKHKYFEFINCHIWTLSCSNFSIKMVEQDKKNSFFLKNQVMQGVFSKEKRAGNLIIQIHKRGKYNGSSKYCRKLKTYSPQRPSDRFCKWSYYFLKLSVLMLPILSLEFDSIKISYYTSYLATSTTHPASTKSTNFSCLT